MHFNALAIFSIIVAGVAADGASIIAALDKVNTDAIALDKTVTNFKSLFDSLAIMRIADTLVKDLNKATEVAKQSGVLSNAEAYSLVPIVNKLNDNTEKALDNLVGKKAAFVKANLKGTVKDYLNKEKNAASEVTDAIIDKVQGESLKQISRDLISPLNEAFVGALAAYQ